MKKNISMVQNSHLCHCSCKSLSQWNTVFLPCAYVSHLFLSFLPSAFLSICVEKEKESKVHCQCKGFNMARQQSYSFLLMNQKHAGASWVSYRDFDLDCSPSIVAVRQGGFILGERDNITSPVSVIHWHTGSSLIFREWKNKMKSGDKKSCMTQCWDWIFSGVEVFFAAFLQTTHLNPAGASPSRLLRD